MARAARHDRAPVIQGPARPADFLQLARPHQWSKSVFVLVGPFYGLRELAAAGASAASVVLAAVIAASAFALASSGCYVINDIFDREADRAHPRKKSRPIAAGRVPLGTAWFYALALFVVGFALVLFLPPEGRGWVALSMALYVANVSAYSAYFKHKVIADVMSLSLGFVLRVMGGCAAVGIEPSVWLLNVTFFLSMFLAFGKRLGERAGRQCQGTGDQGGEQGMRRERLAARGLPSAGALVLVVVHDSPHGLSGNA